MKMTREQAMQALLQKIKTDMLLQAANKLALKQPRNFALKLFIKTFDMADPDHNWFSALAVLCIHQRFNSGILLNDASVLSGGGIMSIYMRRKLIDVIETGAKITKADAGRALDASTGISGSNSST